VGTRILAVEDDERIRSADKLALEDEGWIVDEAESGEEAIELFQRSPPDVVLIDIMLPGIDGFELCRTLRRTSSVPVVMVTARNDTHDVVAGLEAGADDYLTKPFSVRELVARAKALLRRVDALSPATTSAAENEVIDRGNMRIVMGKRQVTVDDEDITLTAKEFDLLAHFARNPGQVFNRVQVLDQVWGYNHEGYEHTVNSHINRLRAKIESDPAKPKYILTVWGVGYKFAE